MNKFECKNCGFIVEQENQPKSCPICGAVDFNIKSIAQTTQAGTGVATSKTAVVSASNLAATPMPRINYAQFREFPTVQRERMKQELEEKINDLQEETAAYFAMQKQKIEKRINRKDILSGIIGMPIILIVIWKTGCTACTACTEGDGAFYGLDLGDAIRILIKGGLIVFAFVLVFNFITRLFLSGDRKEYKQLPEREEQRLDEGKKQLQVEYNRKIQSYADSFEQAAKATIQRFVSNKTMEDIGNCIAVGFLNAIEWASRNENQKDILVSCKYIIYADQIQYEDGVFNFAQNHCTNLTSPVEQAALAQAIATYIEIRVMEKYEKDPCGSVPKIMISNSDVKLSRTVTIQYTAANTNYRSW